MAELSLGTSRGARPVWSTARLRPAEGWTVVALHAVILLAAAWAVSRGGWSNVPPSLPFVAIGGAVVGLLLAKTACPDLLAHLIAFWTGAAAVVAWTTWRFEDLGPTWRARLDSLWARAQEWYELFVAGKQHDDDYLFIIVLGVTFWLVAYMAAWTLYRRRWVTSALLLPGFVIVVNLGYAPRVAPEPLVIYLIAAGTLTARHFAYRRQQEWSRFGIPAPAGLGWRFLGVGGNLAVLLVALAWFLPITSQTAWFDWVQRGLERPFGAIQESWEAWLPELPGAGDGTDSRYADFDDEFQLGGSTGLDATEVARLQSESPGDRPPYLVAARYDVYTGSGWETGVDETFEEQGADGRSYAPQVTFEANQEVVLSDEVTGDRERVSGRVTILGQTSGRLLTLETYLTSDLPTNARLSWIQLDNKPFAVSQASLSSIPPDLRGIALMLLNADMGGTGYEEVAGLPVPLDLELRSRLLNEQARLANRFLATNWIVGTGGRVTLFVTGQLPVYDDIDAINARLPVLPGQTYGVVGLASTATPQELAQAGTDYPDYVEARYLQLPDGVTSATVELAETFAAGAGNPFDMARAIERELRLWIDYDRAVGAPPSGGDAVHYVLFESPRGDCDFYASAMVVMLRSLRIPARMVTGFAPVPFDPAAPGFVYRKLNAHAWVEVFFPGFGWIPFEPTPIQPVREYGPPGPAPTAPVLPTPAPPSPTVEPTPTEAPASPPASGLGVVEAPRDGGVSPVRISLAIGSALIGVVALIGLGLGLVWRRGLAGLPRSAGWYERMLRVGRLVGVRGEPGATPREYAAAFGRAVPAARRPAGVVSDLYAAERYGAHNDRADAAQSGAAAWRSIRRASLRRLLIPGRRRQGGAEASSRDAERG